jgi:hypothetical protein
MSKLIDILVLVISFTIAANIAALPISIPLALGAIMNLSEARKLAQNEANEDGLPRYVVTYISDDDTKEEGVFDVLFMYDGQDSDIIIWSEVRQQAEVFDKVFESLESLPGYEQPL